mmetsp:Transcript_19338/g.42185  ORF Transcript_19338/g.42185 Transcript_19338/m.42185 type:complete len:207 (-) Transcript_19338:513-1133(-)
MLPRLLPGAAFRLALGPQKQGPLVGSAGSLVASVLRTVAMMLGPGEEGCPWYSHQAAALFRRGAGRQAVQISAAILLLSLALKPLLLNLECLLVGAVHLQGLLSRRGPLPHGWPDLISAHRRGRCPQDSDAEALPNIEEQDSLPHLPQAGLHVARTLPLKLLELGGLLRRRRGPARGAQRVRARPRCGCPGAFILAHSAPEALRGS